ncbi:MAG: T9SS type A sorting domain-containing protein [Saprospiraceae bacterium]|nr:T9SS type A sorting domain-containing protein [Saprospiraceae bacterium]
MRILLFFLSLLLGTALLQAQTPSFVWVKALYGPNNTTSSATQVRALDTDAQGNTYLCGDFENTLNLGSGIQTDAAGTQKANFVAKYSPQGVPLWIRSIRHVNPSPGSAFTSISMSTDAAGNVYCAGNYFANSLDFGNGTTLNRTCTNQCTEGFLVKYSSNGDLVFVKGLRAATGLAFEVAGIAADDAGNHYISGTFAGSELWLQGGANIGGLESSGYYLAKYKENGQSEWTTFVNPGSAIPNPNGIAVSPDGTRIAVCGQSASATVQFGNGVSVPGNAQGQPFIVVYSNTSHAQYAGLLSSSGIVNLGAIQINTENQVLASVQFNGNLKWQDVSQGNYNGSDVANHVLRIDQNGASSLTGNIIHTPSTFPVGRIAAGQGGKWFAGGSAGNAISVPGTGDFPSQGCTDVLVIGGQDAQVQWGRRVGQGCEESNIFQHQTLLGAGPNGEVMMAGAFTNSANFNGIGFAGSGLWVGKLSSQMVDASEISATPAAVELSPNPVSDQLHLKFQTPENGILQIRDQTGRLVLYSLINAHSMDVGVQEWPKGIYFLSYMTSKGQRPVCQPFLVQ